jgi:hypothetical protein
MYTTSKSPVKGILFISNELNSGIEVAFFPIGIKDAPDS